MNMPEDWDTPHIKEPSSKMAKKDRNTHYLKVRIPSAAGGSGRRNLLSS